LVAIPLSLASYSSGSGSGRTWRVSSPYLAVYSKPNQDQNAKKRPKPAAGPVKALSGLMGDSGIPSSPPPESRTENATVVSTES